MSRTDIFKALRDQAQKSSSLLDLTSPAMSARGHHSWAWDASAMPAGGHYFPAYIEILAKLEQESGISPETHVLCETTTGTAGLALGFIAKQLGYSIVLFMPEDMPHRRIKAVAESLSAGSKLVLTPAGQYVRGAVRAFRRFIVEQRSGYQGKQICAVDHSRRPEAVSAIEAIILQVIVRLPARIRINYAIAAIGNGTSSAALFRAMMRVYPTAKRIGVEPVEAPMAFVRKYGQEEFLRQFGAGHIVKPHFLLGTGGWGVGFPLLDVSIIDEVLPMTSEDWRNELGDLAQRGLDVGNSSAACQAAAEAISDRKSVV